MRKKTVLTLVACALLGAAVVCAAWGQTSPAAPAGAAPGGGGPVPGAGPIPGMGGRGARRAATPPPAHPAEKGPIVKAQDTKGTPDAVQNAALRGRFLRVTIVGAPADRPPALAELEVTGTLNGQ